MENNQQCYNSPWCEPGERCCCEAYDRDDEERKEEERMANMTPDHVYFTGFCWAIAICIALLVVVEILSK